MVVVFKTDKYLKGIRTLDYGIRINCNTRAVTTNQMENYGNLNRTIIMDGEFEKLKEILLTVECNITVAKEHVSKAEQ